jgi:hypothetical protein
MIVNRKELEQQLFNQYVNELREARRKNFFPLHLYSKRVYRAYHDAWFLVDRSLLTQDEIDVMKKLGIYKESRTQRGIPRYLSKSRIEATNIKIY